MWEDKKIMYFDRGECAPDVHLVGEHEDGQVPLGPDVLVSEQRLELVARHHQPQAVGRVDHENDALAVFVVVLPQLAVPALPRHVERRESHIFVYGKSNFQVSVFTEKSYKKNIEIFIHKKQSKSIVCEIIFSNALLANLNLFTD
jgi:hypothetical protein